MIISKERIISVFANKKVKIMTAVFICIIVCVCLFSIFSKTAIERKILNDYNNVKIESVYYKEEDNTYVAFFSHDGIDDCAFYDAEEKYIGYYSEYQKLQDKLDYAERYGTKEEVRLAALQCSNYEGKYVAFVTNPLILSHYDQIK